MAESLNNLTVVRASGSGTTETYTTSRPFQVIDCLVINVNGDDGTVTVNNAGVAITAALNPANSPGAFVRAATIARTPKNIASGAAITFVPNDAAMFYSCFLTLFPTPGVTG